MIHFPQIMNLIRLDKQNLAYLMKRCQEIHQIVCRGRKRRANNDNWMQLRQNIMMNSTS